MHARKLVTLSPLIDLNNTKTTKLLSHKGFFSDISVLIFCTYSYKVQNSIRNTVQFGPCNLRFPITNVNKMLAKLQLWCNKTSEQFVCVEATCVFLAQRDCSEKGRENTYKHSILVMHHTVKEKNTNSLSIYFLLLMQRSDT